MICGRFVKMKCGIRRHEIIHLKRLMRRQGCTWACIDATKPYTSVPNRFETCWVVRQWSTSVVLATRFRSRMSFRRMYIYVYVCVRPSQMHLVRPRCVSPSSRTNFPPCLVSNVLVIMPRTIVLLFSREKWNDVDERSQIRDILRGCRSRNNKVVACNIILENILLHVNYFLIRQ